MKNKIIAALLGILLIGTLGAAVVSAAISDDVTANDSTGQNGSFGQMHAWCGKYMNSENFDPDEFGSMHGSCGNYMNSGNVESGFSCH